MAKPSWITVVSGSTGSGSGTRSLKASSHTGRSSRSGSIKGVTSGGASDSVVLSQVGAGEFITVDKAYYFVTALGGTVKITGTSNSPSLKLTNLTDSSLLSNFALKVNGTAYSWDGNVSHQISGDPGASSSYTFEISFDVAENQTENSRDITFRLRDSGDPGVSSKIITIRQTEGEKTYGTASVNMRYSNWNIGAEGGVATPSYEFSIPWGWNGKTSGGGTLTQSNSYHSVKYTYYTDPPGSPYNWTLDEHTGEIVMSSLGKNITDSYEAARIKITIIVNGQTLTYTDFVRQDPNKATYTLSSASEDAEKDFAAAEEKAKNSKKSSAAAPGVSLAFTALASAARDAGDSELAAQYCNQAIERGVSGPEIYNQLAISEMEAGDYESAMSHYEEALSLADNETALVIRQNIAVLYEKEGDFAKALEQFKECQAAGADTPEVQKEIRFLESR